MNPHFLHCRWVLYCWATWEANAHFRDGETEALGDKVRCQAGTAGMGTSRIQLQSTMWGRHGIFCGPQVSYWKGWADAAPETLLIDTPLFQKRWLSVFPVWGGFREVGKVSNSWSWRSERPLGRLGPSSHLSRAKWLTWWPPKFLPSWAYGPMFDLYPSDPSVQFSHSVMSDSLLPHGQQHARPPCPSPTPRVYSNSCHHEFTHEFTSWVYSNSCHQWCHPTISSSVIPFSSCLQCLSASGSFQMSQFFTSVH